MSNLLPDFRAEVSFMYGPVEKGNKLTISKQLRDLYDLEVFLINLHKNRGVIQSLKPGVQTHYSEVALVSNPKDEIEQLATGIWVGNSTDLENPKIVLANPKALESFLTCCSFYL